MSYRPLAIIFLFRGQPREFGRGHKSGVISTRVTGEHDALGDGLKKKERFAAVSVISGFIIMRLACTIALPLLTIVADIVGSTI